jgi:hypothetical protein
MQNPGSAWYLGRERWMPEKRVRRHARTWVASVTALVTAPLLALGAGVGSAQADDLPYVAWTAYLPGWSDQFVPSSDNDCVAGRPACLKATLKKFGSILKENAQSCTHEAVFAMTYTRITQSYGYVRDVPGYFQDVPYINHMDAVFAKYYFDAYDAYQSGNRAEVPDAWLTAFDAARDRRMTGTGDLLLGINAHVNRDLPFVLASMGLVRPDGESGKPDFDKADFFLNDASDALMAELSQRFDPTIDDSNDPLGLSYASVMQLLTTWREAAWRNAEALVNAPTAAARALVAQGIEKGAATAANTILLSQAYTPPLTTTKARDAYCAVHKGDTAPMPYEFGTPAPYSAS